MSEDMSKEKKANPGLAEFPLKDGTIPAAMAIFGYGEISIAPGAWGPYGILMVQPTKKPGEVSAMVPDDNLDRNNMAVVFAFKSRFDVENLMDTLMELYRTFPTESAP